MSTTLTKPVYIFVWVLWTSIVYHCNALNNVTNNMTSTIICTGNDCNQQPTTTTSFNTQTSHIVSTPYHQRILEQLQSIDPLLWIVIVLTCLVCCLCGVFLCYCKMQHHFNKEIREHRVILERHAALASLKQVHSASPASMPGCLHAPSNGIPQPESRSASVVYRPDHEELEAAPKVRPLARSRSDHTLSLKYRARSPKSQASPTGTFRSGSANDDGGSEISRKSNSRKQLKSNHSVPIRRAGTDSTIVSYHVVDASGQLWQNPVYTSQANTGRNTIPHIQPMHNTNTSYTSRQDLEYSQGSHGSTHHTHQTQHTNRSRTASVPYPQHVQQQQQQHVQHTQYSQTPVPKRSSVDRFQYVQAHPQSPHVYNNNIPLQKQPLQTIPSLREPQSHPAHVQYTHHQAPIQIQQPIQMQRTISPVQISVPPPPAPAPVQQQRIQPNTPKKAEHMVINVVSDPKGSNNKKSDNVMNTLAQDNMNHLGAENNDNNEEPSWTAETELDGTEVPAFAEQTSNGIAGMMNMFGNTDKMNEIADKDSDSDSTDSTDSTDSVDSEDTDSNE